MNILLIAGGWSSEREVSLSGAVHIEKALKDLGHRVTRLDPLTEFGQLTQAARTHDFAFLNLHGSPGEDGLIQSILELAGCPYQGSGPRASFLALNKAASKQIFRAGGLETADWELLVKRPAPGWTPAFGLPVFLKPNTTGSSVGISFTRTIDQIPAALDAAFACDREVLAEPALAGVEVTCAVLGGETLPPILIRPKARDFFDYQSKYEKDAAEELCPAPLPAHITQAVGQAALAAHELLGLSGYSRADFILVGETPVLLEVNTLPGMTATSLLPRAARAVGLDYTALVARLVELGAAR